MRKIILEILKLLWKAMRLLLWRWLRPILAKFAWTVMFAAVIVIVVVIYGYQFMLLVNKIAVFANTALILLAVVAYSGVFDAGYDPGPQALAIGGAFWPTFIAAALIVMANPISFGAFLGDWSRYIPRATKPRKLIGATILGQGLGLIPLLFGVATATLVFGKSDYVVSLIHVSPRLNTCRSDGS